MKHFLPAIKLSLRYRWSIVGAVICSFIVAILCTASITTVYPVVESVFQKKTFMSWLDEEIEHAGARRDQLESEIETIQQQLTVTNNRRDQELLNDDLDQKSGYVAAEQRAIDYYNRIRPTVERYAPGHPLAPWWPPWSGWPWRRP